MLTFMITKNKIQDIDTFKTECFNVTSETQKNSDTLFTLNDAHIFLTNVCGLTSEHATSDLKVAAMNAENWID